jgi:hypothetical protein
VGETTSLNIGALESSRNVNISTECSDKEEMKFDKLLGGSQKVYAWTYKNLHGFDPDLLQNAIPIKESMKPVMQEQRSINSAFKAIFQRELGKLLRAGIIFSVHPKWVSNWLPSSKTIDHIRTCIKFCTFNQIVMRNPFPPLNMEIILQEVVKLQLRPLLDNFLGCRNIKVKGEDAHKTTLITNWGTMTYKFLFSSLPDAIISFRRPIHTIFDELVSIHIYLDDLIVCVKGMIITSEFQVLFMGPFKIAFVLDTNYYILKDL